jgi:hypothetical protein
MDNKTFVLTLSEARTWLVAALFVIGNVIVPQTIHAIPGLGAAVGPIYFLTLFAALRYGAGVGLVTAVFSPVANNLLFGMPPDAVVGSIIVKSVLLALAASWSVKLVAKQRS